MIKNVSIAVIMTMLTACTSLVGKTPTSVEPNDQPEIISKPRLAELPTLRKPDGPPIVVAVYSFTDKTGQRKPNDKFSCDARSRSIPYQSIARCRQWHLVQTCGTCGAGRSDQRAAVDPQST